MGTSCPSRPPPSPAISRRPMERRAPAPHAAHGAASAHAWRGPADPTRPPPPAVPRGGAGSHRRAAGARLPPPRLEHTGGTCWPSGAWRGPSSRSGRDPRAPTSSQHPRQSRGSPHSPGSPLVPCWPPAQAPGATPCQSHRAAAPREQPRPGHGGLRHGAGLQDPSPAPSPFTALTPPQQAPLVLRESPPSRAGGGTGQRPSLLLPLDG